MKWIKPIHKWLSLLVGLQLLIWLGTGLFFNLADHQAASGNQNRQTIVASKPDDLPDLAPVAGLPVDNVEQVTLHWIQGQHYYQVIHQSQPHAKQSQHSTLYEATSGKPIALSDRQLTDIALASYAGEAKVKTAGQLTPPVDDLPGHENPVWQVRLADTLNTAVYVNPANGRVIRHMNDDSRLWDFMLMLHFMDYTDTGGFNHPLIIIVALGTLMLAASGVIWLVERLRNLGVRLPWRQHWQPVKVVSAEGTVVSNGPFDGADTVLEGLAGQQVGLASSCGGGGSCGLCKVMLDPQTRVASCEREHLSADELASGVRLACQHQWQEVERVALVRDSVGERHEMTLVEAEFVTPYIKRLSFCLNHKPALDFTPGDSMQFVIPEGEHNRRPPDLPDCFIRHWQDIDEQPVKRTASRRQYSIAQYEPETHRLTFFVRWQQPEGIGSGYLGSLRKGDKVMAYGPVSDFSMPEHSENKKVFIGAGSGIAPLYSMIQSLSELASPPPALLFYGARSEVDVVGTVEFEQLDREKKWFEYYPVLSRPSIDWQGEVGYVQKPLERYLSQHGIDKTEFYLCGPPAMMRAVRELLLHLGVSRDAIRQDDFSVNKRS